jgi:hypothetical protein
MTSINCTGFESREIVSVARKLSKVETNGSNTKVFPSGMILICLQQRSLSFTGVLYNVYKRRLSYEYRNTEEEIHTFNKIT